MDSDLVDESVLPSIEVLERAPTESVPHRKDRGRMAGKKRASSAERTASEPASPSASESSASSRGGQVVIPKDLVNNLPMYGYEGDIHIVNADDQIYDAVLELRKETVLGFDTETRPTFRAGVNHPVALLQLAGSKSVYLFQLLQLKDVSPVFGLLASPRIEKVGVAIRDDIRKLQDTLPFEPNGFMEISDLSTRAGILNTGLRALCAHYMGIRISKGAQVSNWALKTLSDAQIRYAATDAWVSRELYLKLRSLGLK